MRVGATIQARERSRRLPGKVRAEAAGRALLEHQLQRLRCCETLDVIVIATCDPFHEITKIGRRNGVPYWIGPEEDVLTRILGAAHFHALDTIVELTADCPLIDPKVVDECVRLYTYWTSQGIKPEDRTDFVTTSRDCFRDLTRAYPRGMDVRVFSTRLLEEVDRLTADPADREHVSLYVWEHPERYAIDPVLIPEDERETWGTVERLGIDRLTVDTPEDLELIRRIFEYFAPRNDFSFQEVVGLLEENPDWLDLNRDVKQKEVREDPELAARRHTGLGGKRLPG